MLFMIKNTGMVGMVLKHINYGIDFLFTSTDLHRLGMSTWSGNIRMMKVAERIGMKEEARIRNARTVDGEYFDAIKMGMLREEWEKQNSN